MNNINTFFEEEIKNRTDELFKIKKYIHSSFISEDLKAILITSCIPLIYAHWEGFVSKSFQFYVGELNKQNLTLEKIHINYLTYAIDKKCELKNPRENIGKKIRFTEDILDCLSNPILFSTEINTESNVNYKVINKLLEQFNMEKLELKYKKPLDRLLRFRNDIAHGNFGITININDLDEFTILVEDLMYQTYIKILNSHREQNYLQ